MTTSLVSRYRRHARRGIITSTKQSAGALRQQPPAWSPDVRRSGDMRSLPKPISALEIPQERQDLFWSLIDQSAGATACWPWVAGAFSTGYGAFRVGRRTCKASRVAYALRHGEVPSEAVICHRCDNPICCNPAHLFLGDTQMNNADMVRKGRQAKGERTGVHTKPESRAVGSRNGTHTHPESLRRGDRHWMRQHPGVLAGDKNGRAKLTEADVIAIRRAYASGERIASLARQYNINWSTAKKIVTKQLWSHVSS